MKATSRKTKTNLKTVSAGVAIKCDNLAVDYRRFRALENISCEFVEGSLTAVVGPNGGGKSTLLKTLAGDMMASQGGVTILPQHTQHIAYLPQTPDIDRSFPITVSDVVGMGLCSSLGFFKSYAVEHRDLIRSALDRVGLADCSDRPIHCLSGGQFQRALFARISLQDAKIILLDEPFAAIDAATMDILVGVLQDWQRQGKTIVTVLHDLDIVKQYFPTTMVIARSLIANGPTYDTLTRENLEKAKLLVRAWESCCTESLKPKTAA